MECLHSLEVTGCPFQWYCHGCSQWITFSFGGRDPCEEKWCHLTQCHNYGKPMHKERVLTQILSQFYNTAIYEATELGKKLVSA